VCRGYHLLSCRHERLERRRYLRPEVSRALPAPPVCAPTPGLLALEKLSLLYHFRPPTITGHTSFVSRQYLQKCRLLSWNVSAGLKGSHFYRNGMMPFFLKA
jgi:hypothetical protein